MILFSKKKILVAGIPRSGTHFLFETIKKEIPDDYISISEPFNLETLALRKFPVDLTDTEQLRGACEYVINRILGYDHVIMKCNTEEFERLKQLEIFDTVRFETDYHKILLLRRDLVAHVMSYAISSVTQEFKDYTYTEVVLNEQVVDAALRDIVNELDYIFDGLSLPSFDQIVYYEDVVKYANGFGYEYSNLQQAPDKKQVVIDYQSWIEYIQMKLEAVEPKNFSVLYGMLHEYDIRMTA
jgi:hypothetical protein